MSLEIDAMRFRIIEKVTEEIKEIISGAEKESKQILKNAKEEGHRTLMSRVGAEVRMIRSKIVGRAELEGRRTVLKAKEEVVSKVFEEVEKRLNDIVSGKDSRFDYGDILLNLANEAVIGIGEREIVIMANNRDKGFLSKNLATLEKHLREKLGYKIKLRIADKELDCVGGIIAHDNARKKIYYNTLIGRMTKVRDMMRARVAKELGLLGE